MPDEQIFENEIKCIIRRNECVCNGGSDCIKCDLLMDSEEIVKCYNRAIKNIELINRQKAEIERNKGVIKLLEKDVEDEKAEIENLKVELKAMRGADNSYKNEAIKEFVKLIIDKSQDGVIRTADIPDFVKEMTEEK